jgi:hypothetical protein
MPGHLGLDVVHLVPGVHEHLPLARFHLSVLGSVVKVHSRMIGVNSVEVGVDLAEAAEHLVKGVVLEQEQNDVFDRVAGLLVRIHRGFDPILSGRDIGDERETVFASPPDLCSRPLAWWQACV